jgi:hypothetical protein
MADSKYRYMTIVLNKNQKEVVERACDALKAELGFELSRSDAVCLILSRYTNQGVKP